MPNRPNRPTTLLTAEGNPERRRNMKRILTVTLIVGFCLSITSTAEAKPNLGRWRGPCSTWQYGERQTTPAIWNSHPERSHRQMVRLVTCVFDKYAPGNAGTAVAIMERESHGYPWALNSSSGCAGLFQHITWDGRATYYLEPWMFAPNVWVPSAFDPRANAIVAAKMVADHGWGAWGG